MCNPVFKASVKKLMDMTRKRLDKMPGPMKFVGGKFLWLCSLVVKH